MARHLVAAGQIIDEDSELALLHAIAARRLASRIAVVREAVGLAAYAAGDWTTAIAELRTYHRMTGKQTHLAELADCERALGRPERAIDLFRGADKESLDKAGAIELLIVAAGARGDLGQNDAAVAMLQVKELTTEADAEWAARLRYAYADALLAADRRDEAREWFSRAAAADDDGMTDAAERMLELDGVSIEGDEDDEDEDDAQDGAADTKSEAQLDDDEDDDEDLDDELDQDVDAGIDEDDEDEDDDDEDDDLAAVAAEDEDEDAEALTDGDLAGADADDLAAKTDADNAEQAKADQAKADQAKAGDKE
ncbi:Replicase polyprotein 1ab [Winogradskya humida]|uniref:Replicase polyprotein 1ab n=1 Tax=Winogradskya humida TaxID=113566 RepID=UPI001EF2B196|nr:Replicase polyprotein 1ab [Actinoplanes humidus]